MIRGNQDVKTDVPGVIPGCKYLLTFKPVNTYFMDLEKKEFKLWEIWTEGYAATGESCTAFKLGEYWADSFDEAVEKYNEKHPTTGAVQFTKESFISDEAYKTRRSNWNIWACALFDTEEEARKSFG